MSRATPPSNQQHDHYLDGLMYLLNPAAFARDYLGFHPDPLQTQVLNSRARRGLLCCTRQWGKSTVLAILALHTAYFQPGATVLVAAPAQRQSDELVRKCALFLERLNIRRRSDGTNRGSVVLPNLSRIVSLPHCEQSIRGFSAPDLILVDEAARVPDELADALSPMLATNNGALWLLSTPFGREGIFYHEWQRHPSDWLRISATAADCPRISADFLASEARRMTRSTFQREYFCKFHAAEDALFQDGSLDNLLQDAIPVLA